jgi:hypothetical protein
MFNALNQLHPKFLNALFNGFDSGFQPVIIRVHGIQNGVEFGHSDSINVHHVMFPFVFIGLQRPKAELYFHCCHAGMESRVSQFNYFGSDREVDCPVWNCFPITSSKIRFQNLLVLVLSLSVPNKCPFRKMKIGVKGGIPRMSTKATM